MNIKFVVLKNEKKKEVKLIALHLKNYIAKTIAAGIAKFLDKYNLFLKVAIKMIIIDTTKVNTGKRMELFSNSKICSQ